MQRDENSRAPSQISGLTIRLFGGMAIQDARGADYLPRSRKTRALVAYLALNAPKPVQRLQLTKLLWSRRETEQARASLRQSVHELQRTLGANWGPILSAERHTLTLDLHDVAVDAIAASRPSAPRTALLTLFQGGFLDDLTGVDPSFDIWLAEQRGRLVAIARASGEAFLRERHTSEQTIGVARALLRVDRSHDAAWRGLIQAHMEANDRAAAHFACEQWAETMGLPPGQLPPEMAEVLTRIQSRSWQPPANDTPADLARMEDTAAFDLAAWVAESPVALSLPDVAHPPKPVRTGLLLGVREMRIIGANVDEALPVGLAEEITTALARFRWISCVSGSSLAAISGQSDEAELRWSDMDLDLVLDGAIQRGGDRLRITVRLLDMRAAGMVIWAHRFDQAIADSLLVQEAVAAAIVAQLDPVLLMREGELAAIRGASGNSAHDLVLRAIPAIYRLDRSSFRRAGELLETALRLEPDHIDALAWFAYWHLFLVGQGWADDPAAATRRAANLADSAVAMDPNDARALTLAGHVRGFLMKRPSEALVLHERAISLNPNLALAWCFSGFARSYLGQQEAALAQMTQAIQLSPSDPHLFFFQAAIIMPHLLRGEYHEAAGSGLKAIELNPWFSSAFKGYLAVLGHLGAHREAASVMARLLKLEPTFTVADAIRRSPMTSAEDIKRYADGLRLAQLPEF